VTRDLWRPRVVHLHDPQTGGHACGAPVSDEFVAVVLRGANAVAGPSGVGSRRVGSLADEYLGGEWCCETDMKRVTCRACSRVRSERRDGGD